MTGPTSSADPHGDRTPQVPVSYDAEPADVVEQAEELPPDEDELEVVDDEPEPPVTW